MLTRNQKRKLELINDSYTNNSYINAHNKVLNKIPKLDTNKKYADNEEVLEFESNSSSLELNSSDSSDSEISDSNSEISESQSDSNSTLESDESDVDLNEEIEVKESYSSQNEESYDTILKSFDTNISSVLNGEFFNLYPNKYNIKTIKNKYNIKTIETLNEKLDLLRSKYLINDAEIDNIINMNIPEDIKLKALEKIYLITNSDILSDEYNYYVKELKEILYYSNSTNLLSLDKEICNILDKDNSGNLSMSYKNKILKSEMSFNNKVIAYKYMRIIESYRDQSSEELAKYKTWLNTLLTIPFNKYHNNKITYNSSMNEIKQYLFNIRQLLDKNLSFLEYPKDQIINIIAQLIRNPNSQINAIGMYGNKGIGKTHFVESISEALGRPLVRISLGGNSDVLSLKGHNFTYIGSKQGKIIDGLIESKVMNPIIFFDEIDKISKSYHGSDITGLLIHLIDLTTNNKFNGDEYFSGIEFDLSRALFIFTYNDPDLVDPILADRLYKIKINNYTKEEKIQITTKHLLDTILKQFNLTQSDIIISKDIIEDIVNLSNDSGMRSIKNNIQIIISRLNTLLLTDPTNNVITLKYKSLYKYYNTLPIILKREHINLLLDSTKTNKDDNYLRLYT
jgi:ATP-dependent Lon protease